MAEELAGRRLPIDAALDVYETLAYADASVGWIAWNNSLPCLLGRFLAPAARAEIFTDPQWLYACSTRPTGRAAPAADGYRVRGRWDIVSGCELAEWILLLCVVEERTASRACSRRAAGAALRVPAPRRLQDPRHVARRRAARHGQPRLVVENVRVPRALTLFVAEPSTLDGPLGRIPIICSMAAGYGAQALGVAQSAVDTLVELTSTKAPPEGAPLRERPAVLGEIGRHNAALEAARAYLHVCAAQLWRTAVAGGPPALDEITAMWGAGLHAAEAAEKAVDAMYAAGGINSLYTACRLERAHRDMHAMRRHIVGQAMWFEDAGRVESRRGTDASVVRDLKKR